MRTFTTEVKPTTTEATTPVAQSNIPVTATPTEVAPQRNNKRAARAYDPFFDDVRALKALLAGL